MSPFLVALGAHFAGLLWISFRGLGEMSAAGAGSRLLVSRAVAALREDDEATLGAVARTETAIGRALGEALARRGEGGRPSLAVREARIAARARATRALNPLRVGATLASALGLLGALHAILFGSDVMPIELLARGAVETDRLGRAALSVVAGLGVHAYAMQAYAALRRDAAETLDALLELQDSLAGLESGCA